MTARGTPGRRLARYLCAAWLPDATAVWLVLLVCTCGVVAALNASGGTPQSVWEQAAIVPRWAVLAVGGYLAVVSLPLQVSHGSTRREFAVRTGLFTVAFTGFSAVLMSVGFALEGLLFRSLGWTHGLTRPHLFAEPGQYAVIAAEYWLVLAAWTVAGVLIGIAYYRFSGGAVAVAVPALLVLLPVELAVGTYLRPALEMFFAVTWAPGPVTAAVTSAGGFLVALGATWYIVRDVPINPTTA